MSRYDGTDEPLTFEEVLVELVRKATWGSEAEAREAEEVVRKYTGLWNEPVAAVNPHESDAERELAVLRERNAALEAAARQRAAADELDALRAKNAELEAAMAGDPAEVGGAKAPK